MSDKRSLTRSVITLALASLAPVVFAMAAESQNRTSAGSEKSGIVTAPKEADPRPSPFPEPKRSTQLRPRLIIPAGTAIAVRLGETLDTKRVRAGDRFSASLDEPIIVRGRVVVPKGTIFSGYVAESKPSGRVHGRGVLGLTLDSFHLDGVTYRVETSADFHRSGDNKK